MVPSASLDPFSFTFVIALTDVKISSTFHPIPPFIPLETSFVLALTFDNPVDGPRGSPRSVYYTAFSLYELNEISARDLIHNEFTRCTSRKVNQDGYR